jgi:sugar lactone lactonase YvrE
VAVDANGNFFIAETVNNRIRKVDTNGIITTFAGKVGTGFSGDGGFATNATLNSPSGVALDANGNLLIADTGNNRIRKVDASGIITTAAGKGSFGYSGDGGKATNASVSSPSGVAVDNSNYLLIADSGNNRVRQVDAGGIITNLAGNGSSTYSGDGGAATNAGLYPFGVAVDSSENLCIADYINNRIRKVALNRFPALTLANVTTNNTGNYDVIINGSSGSVTSSIVTLTVVVPSTISSQPQSVTVTNGNPASLTLTAFGTAPLNYQWYFNGTTAVDGGTNATLNFSNATTNQSGNYFCVITNAYGSVTSVIATLTAVVLPGITTQPTNQIVVTGGSVTFTVSASGTGPFTYQWQLNGTNLPHSSGGTNPPSYRPYNIVTVAGQGNDVGFGGDGGPAVSAELFYPYGASVDSFGNIFIADKVNNRIRKVDTNGIITTIAGVGPSAANGSYSGDSGAATNANLNFPIGIAVDGTRNLFIADSWNNRIRKVDTNGIITTVAGTNSSGFSGDGGAATSAKLNNPSTVFVDSSGNLLLADTGNNRIRRIDTNGIITTIAGTNAVGYSGDGGTATNAMLTGPNGVAADGFGNYYIADTTNNCIRKIDINGIITTFAGNGTAGYSGDGGAATNASLNQPYGVAVDAYGQVFFADYNNSRIRVVNASGIITTLVGNGTAGYSDGGGIATNASLNHPAGLNFDNSGNLLIADQGNYRIRKVDFWGVPTLTLTKVTARNLGNYSVIINSPFGSVTSSVAALTVILPPQNFTASMGNNLGVQLRFSGTPGWPYVLQAATNLAPPVNWQSVITNLADTNGNWSFTDTNLIQYPQRFYRASP